MDPRASYKWLLVGPSALFGEHPFHPCCGAGATIGERWSRGAVEDLGIVQVNNTYDAQRLARGIVISRLVVNTRIFRTCNHDSHETGGSQHFFGKTYDIFIENAEKLRR